VRVCVCFGVCVCLSCGYVSERVCAEWICVSVCVVFVCMFVCWCGLFLGGCILWFVSFGGCVCRVF